MVDIKMEMPETLTNNLDILRSNEAYVEYAYLVERALQEEAPFWREEPSAGETGEPTAYIEDENGERHYIEARENPAAIAFGRMESLGDVKNIVVMGVGLGYTLEALNAELEKGKDEYGQIIIIERYSTMLARALAQADLSTLLKRENTQLVLGYVPMGFGVDVDPERTAVIKNHILTRVDEEYYTVALANLNRSAFRILPL